MQESCFAWGTRIQTVLKKKPHKFSCKKLLSCPVFPHMPVLCMCWNPWFFIFLFFTWERFKCVSHCVLFGGLSSECKLVLHWTCSIFRKQSWFSICLFTFKKVLKPNNIKTNFNLGTIACPFAIMACIRYEIGRIWRYQKSFADTLYIDSCSDKTKLISFDSTVQIDSLTIYF